MEMGGANTLTVTSTWYETHNYYHGHIIMASETIIIHIQRCTTYMTCIEASIHANTKKGEVYRYCKESQLCPSCHITGV